MYHIKRRNYECWALEPPSLHNNIYHTRFHRTDGPAQTYKNGNILVEEYWQDGVLFRSNGPCIIITNLETNTIIDHTWHVNEEDLTAWLRDENITLEKDLTIPHEHQLMFKLKFL